MPRHLPLPSSNITFELDGPASLPSGKGKQATNNSIDCKNLKQ